MNEPMGWYGLEKLRQETLHASGFALKRHCDNAHGGDVDPKCNACAELQKKMQNT